MKGNENESDSFYIIVLELAFLLMSLTATAEMALLPEVTFEMTNPAYWAGKSDMPDSILTDASTIEALNSAFLSEEACHMKNLLQSYAPYDGAAYRGERVQQAMSALSRFMSGSYYRADDVPVRFSDVKAVLESIDEAEVSDHEQARYGICVELANVRAVPTELLITDAVGDYDFDTLQYSYVRVNEPVVIRAQTADGSWYYCETWCVGGWIKAEHIAICKDREEWLAAWQIPEEELLVVTEGRIHLDASNANSASSQRMLTMGTTLRLVRDEDFDSTITNRAVYHNTAVWLPVRDEEGRYMTTIALIPQHCSVNRGYLPLTTENIMKVAFTTLGDAYGWGGMLAEPDCSLYMRNVYKCFGLELPRNTTWQSAMPAFKTDLSDMEAQAKVKVLDSLPAGTILFLKGHEMMYLGEVNGFHYVISTMGSIMNSGVGATERIRSVAINMLEESMRTNGATWLESLTLAIQPWLPASTKEIDDHKDALSDAA